MALVRVPLLRIARGAAIVALALPIGLASCGGSAGDSPGTGGSNGTAGTSGSAGTSGTAGTGGSAGTVGTGGSVGTAGGGGSAGAGGGGGGSTGGSGGATGGTGATGTGGAVGAAGTTGTAGTAGSTGGGASAGRGGTTGTAGRGGATGSAGSGGSAAGSGGTAGATGTGGSGGANACPVIADFMTAWPTGKGPSDIGKLAVTNFHNYLAGMLPINSNTYGGAGYALAFTWFGALRFSKFTGDTTNNTYFITQFDPYASGSVTVDNGTSATVDSRAFGDLPMEIFLQNNDMRCKTLGLARADQQWASVDGSGITKDARYWADDMYMITALQDYAYRVTKDTKYLTRAATTMLSYQAMLQQSDGLFWHTMTSHAYWGRANGWVAAGAAELLVDLPAGSQRDMVMAGFKKQLDGLLTKQVSGGTDDGMWRQVLDVSTANAESSCTAMFTFALTTALKNGWISGSNYSAAARRGWLAVANKTNAQGQLDRVCPGTGAAPSGSLASQQQFYTSITLGSNDTHGQAALLWLAHALLRTDCPGMR